MLILHGHYNSSFWILSINSKEFSSAPAVVPYLKSLQTTDGVTYVHAIFAHHIASNHTRDAGDRV